MGGRRASVSTHGSVTGRGFDFIIIDDPLDAAEAASQTACERVIHLYDSSLSTRLTHPTKSAIVLVMQRLSVCDLSAHVAEQEPWARLVIPAIAEQDTKFQIGSDEVHVFKQGELLDTERLSQDFLDTQRKKMGEAAFLAQYLQRPVPAGGGEIDISKFQRYDKIPREFEVRFLSIDAASGVQAGSYSVIQLFQVTDGMLYLLQSVRGFWTFPSLLRRVQNAQEKVKANFLVIENASAGQALLEQLWELYPFELRRKILQPMKPTKSKEVRMAKAMVSVEASLVLWPKKADWLEALISEFQTFPSGANDDQVDAFSQAVEFYRRYLKSHYNPLYKGGGRVSSGG